LLVCCSSHTYLHANTAAMKEFEINEEIYGMIIDDMDQSITPAHKEVLDQWRKANPENEKTYQDFLHVQLNLDKLYKSVGTNSDSSWIDLDKKLIDNNAPVLKMQKSKSRIFEVLKIAAVLFISLGVSYYFINKTQTVIIQTEADSKTANVTLPDGTLLTVNASTTVKYNKNSFLKDRKLELINGEIFINVNPGKAQFRVAMGDVEAKDIGTKFNILRDNKQVSVTVEQGVVALKQISSNKEVTLVPGKAGIYMQDGKQLQVIANKNVNYKSWIDKTFIFTETPLAEVAAQLEKAYRTRVEVKGERLKRRNFSGRLNYPGIEAALAVISESLQCKMTKSNGVYVFHDN